MVRLITLSLCLVLVLFGVETVVASMPHDMGNPDADAYSAQLKSENVPGWEHSFEYAWGQATLIRERATGVIHLTVNFFGLETPVIESVLMRGRDNTVLHHLPTSSMFVLTIEDPDPEIAEALADRELVMQVSDERYPDGAIRGVFTHEAVDINATTWSSVKSLFN